MYTDAEKRSLVEELACSGETMTAFAKARGVSRATLSKWRKELESGEAPTRKRQERYTPGERREAVEAFLKSGRKRKDFAKLWGLSPWTLDSWVKRYRAAGPKALEDQVPERRGPRKSHPARLPDEVRQEVVRTRKEHPSFGLRRVAQFLARFRGLRVSPSSVGNVLREEGVPARLVAGVGRRRS